MKLVLDILPSKDGKEVLVFNMMLPTSHQKQSETNGPKLVILVQVLPILNLIKK
jgi:hypothetical protein